MITIYIIAAILFAVSYFVFASIRLRMIFNEKSKTASITYTLARFKVNLVNRTGVVYFLGIPLKRVDFADAISFGKVKKVFKKREKKQKAPHKTKKVGAKFTFKIEDLEHIRYVLTKIRLTYLDINIAGSFTDPYNTGIAYAWYSALSGIMPSFMSHIRFNPDFSADSLVVRGKGIISLRIIYILALGMKFLKVYLGEKFKSRFIVNKKGAVYG
jgi:hypothetical protein